VVPADFVRGCREYELQVTGNDGLNVKCPGKESKIVLCGSRRSPPPVSGPGGFGLDSLIEIGASVVVKSGSVPANGSTGPHLAGLRLIGYAFTTALAMYLLLLQRLVLSAGRLPPAALSAGIAVDRVDRGWSCFARWLAVTAEDRAGAGYPGLRPEGPGDMIAAILAVAVLLGPVNDCGTGLVGRPTPAGPGLRTIPGYYTPKIRIVGRL